LAEEKGSDCGIPNICRRDVPAWLVAVDNLPTIIMFILGAAVIWLLWWLFAVIYIAYCAISIVLFWAFICPYCHHFNTKACPCGYGAIAPRFFKSKKDKCRDFRKIFRFNIAIMFPCWLVPTIAGIYILATAYSLPALALLACFCVVGFALIPLISIFVGCKNCDVKKDCPWMMKK